MKRLQRMVQFGGGWHSALTVLMLTLFGPMLIAHVGANVVAWGAGESATTNPPNDYEQSIIPADLTNAVLVAGGWRQSVALKADGTLQGWGDDSLGQLDFPAGSNYVAIACGDQHSLALKSDGTVVVASEYNFYGEANVPSNLSNVVAVASGYYHCLALKSDGTVAAWGGLNEDNGMNDGDGSVPSGLSNVVAIAAGGYHNLVLKSDGTLFAWGDNTYGQTNIPAGLSNVVAIAAGADHNLALRMNGTVAAWGLDNSNQTDVPSGLTNVVAIAAKGDHNLALKANGTVVAWGQDNEGDTIVPLNLTNVTQIAAGDMHSLALTNGPPVIKTMLLKPTLGTNGFSVMAATRNGRVYQLEYEDLLTSSVWQSLPLQAGTGNTSGLQLLSDPTTASRRFYRVVQW